MIIHRLFIVILCLAAFATATIAKAETPAEAFAKVHQEWTDFRAEAQKLMQSFRGATPEKQNEIRQKLMGMQKEAEGKMLKLEAAAIAAFKAAPNEDKKVIELLVGLAESSLSMDQNQKAQDLIDLLQGQSAKHARLAAVSGMVAYCNEKFDLAETYLKEAQKTGSLGRAGGYLQGMDKTKKLWAAEKTARAMDAKADDLPRVKMETTKGTMVIELYENEAPQAVGNFISLVEKGYYDGLIFHRVLPGFMAQGGCPDGTGRGGPGYKIYCETDKPNYRGHFTGTLSMAHAGKNTGGSQFFLTFRPTPHLDGRHTAFGRVIEGKDILAKLERVNPQRPIPGMKPDKMVKVTVIRKRDHEYKPTKVE